MRRAGAALALLLAGCAPQAGTLADRAPRPASPLQSASAPRTSGLPAPPRTSAPAPPRASEQPRELRLVERAVDGDTLLLAGGERVRLLGIDTPELRDPHPAARALAQQAHRVLAVATEGKRVALVPGPEPRDRHGRLLAHVESAEGTDYGAELLAVGLARPYPAPHARAEHYRELASQAREAGIGIWAEEPGRVLRLLPEADVACHDARPLPGRLVRVQGRLRDERRAPRVHRLQLDCEAGSLQVIVFPSRYDEIPPELIARWLAGPVAITGEITEHRGQAQVILEDPFQVQEIAAR